MQSLHSAITAPCNHLPPVYPSTSQQVEKLASWHTPPPPQGRDRAGENRAPPRIAAKPPTLYPPRSPRTPRIVHSSSHPAPDQTHHQQRGSTTAPVLRLNVPPYIRPHPPPDLTPQLTRPLHPPPAAHSTTPNRVARLNPPPPVRSHPAEPQHQPLHPAHPVFALAIRPLAPSSGGAHHPHIAAKPPRLLSSPYPGVKENSQLHPPLPPAALAVLPRR